jgi:hypothetical protein
MPEGALEGELHGEAPERLVAAAGVQGLAHHLDGPDAGLLDAEEGGDFLGEVGFAGGYGHGELAEDIGGRLGGRDWIRHTAPGGRVGPQWKRPPRRSPGAHGNRPRNKITMARAVFNRVGFNRAAFAGQELIAIAA